MFVLKPTNQFKKDVKTILKRSAKNANHISNFLEKLQIEGVSGIDKKHCPHKLNGNYDNDWEAHIKPDLLIISFEIIEDKEIILLRLGSHADLF
jgi:mRNA interferase YafQ